MIKINDVAEDFQLCWPDLWYRMSAMERAKKVAQIFMDDFIEDFDHLRKSREANRMQEEFEKNQRIERREKYHQKMHGIIMEAERFYGDIVYEYCGGCGRNPEDEKDIFAKIERGDFDDDLCKREALYTAFAHQGNDCDWYDRMIRYWNKSVF